MRLWSSWPRHWTTSAAARSASAWLLYDYIQRRLLEANIQQSDAPLAEGLGLLSTLSEAWAGIRKAQDEPVAESPWSQPVAEEAGRGLQGWSL
jgi:hypothetical protein